MPEPKKNSTGARTPRTGDLIKPPTMVQSEKPAPEPVKTTGIWGYLSILLLGVIAFAPIFTSDLLWTDYDLVERSAFRSMESWSEAWSLNSVRYDDPVTLTSFFAEQAIPLDRAPVHRGINLLLHLLAAIALLKILEALKLRGALVATLVFALHPSALQTLFWPGYRHEITGLVFILASIFFGLRHRSTVDLVLMLVLGTIASIIHGAALTIPLILALGIFYQKKSFHLVDYNRLLPLFCLVLFIGVWTNAGVALPPPPEGFQQTTLIGENLFYYLRQSLLPLSLSLFHPFDGGQGYSVGAQNSLLPFLLFIPFFVLVAFNHRAQWARGILLGLSAFLLLVIYGLTRTGQFVDGSLAKESYAMYVALPAIIAVVICGLASLFFKMGAAGKVLWAAASGLFLLLQVSLTAGFSYTVSDTPKLWKSMSEQWTDSWVTRAALVDIVRAGKSDLLSESEMIQTLVEILEQRPDLHNERMLLARTYREAGQSRNALREYRRILRDTEPGDDFLREAAELLDRQGLNWEADNVRERIAKN